LRWVLPQVWVLDALPGDIRAGGEGRKDHPADVIAALQALPLPIRDRGFVQAYLTGCGFSDSIAKWISTNLRPLSDVQRELVWSFDLDGIAEMYQSYEITSLWPFLREPQVSSCTRAERLCENVQSAPRRSASLLSEQIL
jgi:hypothetical protein